MFMSMHRNALALAQGKCALWEKESVGVWQNSENEREREEGRRERGR